MYVWLMDFKHGLSMVIGYIYMRGCGLSKSDRNVSG